MLVTSLLTLSIEILLSKTMFNQLLEKICLLVSNLFRAKGESLLN